MKKIKIILPLILVFSIIFTPLTTRAYEADGVEIQSKSAILYSLDTNDVMYSKNADEQRYPASLTKLMTAVITVENCDDIDKKITINSDDFAEISGSGATVANLKDGEEITIRDLLNLLLISSSADAADSLAAYIGGSVDNFVKMMNEKAASLKMNNTHFMNAHGLHDDNHYTTANDMLKLAVYVTKMPVIMEICARSSYKTEATNKSDSRNVTTTNMLQDASTAYYYKYARGMKTGFTTPAGRCLISTASYKGYNYLCVILGGDDSVRSEYSDTKALYRWAFLNFEFRKIADVNDVIDEINVELSWDTDHIQLFPEKQVNAIVPSDISNSSIVTDVVLNSDSVNAPIEKGQVMGYVRFVCAKEEIARVNLVANEKVDRSVILLIKQTAISIVSNQIFKLLVLALVLLFIAMIIVNIIHNRRKRRQVKRVRRIRRY